MVKAVMNQKEKLQDIKTVIDVNSKMNRRKQYVDNLLK
jgi:hypothetical protein